MSDVCSFCKTEINDGATVCTGCGARKTTRAALSSHRSSGWAMFMRIVLWCNTVGLVLMVSFVMISAPLRYVANGKKIFEEHTWACVLYFDVWRDGPPKPYRVSMPGGKQMLTAKSLDLSKFIPLIPPSSGKVLEASPPKCEVAPLVSDTEAKLKEFIDRPIKQGYSKFQGKVQTSAKLFEVNNGDLSVGAIDYALAALVSILSSIVFLPLCFIAAKLWRWLFHTNKYASQEVWVRSTQ